MKTPDEETPQTRLSGRRGQQAIEIAGILRNDIIGGKLTEEDKLSQEHFAKRFGVSRMPVREAMRLLEAEGLIEFAPNKSARVSPLSVDDLREIYEMRIAAETLALKIALDEISNTQIEHAAKLQTRMEQSELADFGHLNAMFHKTLYAPCRRPRLLAHIDTLGHAADRYLRLTIASLDYADKSNREHHELLDACKARNKAAAIDCLTRHIEEAGAALSALMSRPSDGGS